MSADALRKQLRKFALFESLEARAFGDRTSQKTELTVVIRDHFGENLSKNIALSVRLV